MKVFDVGQKLSFYLFQQDNYLRDRWFKHCSQEARWSRLFSSGNKDLRSFCCLLVWVTILSVALHQLILHGQINSSISHDYYTKSICSRLVLVHLAKSCRFVQNKRTWYVWSILCAGSAFLAFLLWIVALEGFRSSRHPWYCHSVGSLFGV